MIKKLRPLIIFIFILFILDFVPIKFAKKTDIIYDNYTDGVERYICVYRQSAKGTWVAETRNNKSLNEQKVFFRLSKSPFDVLSSEFCTDYKSYSGNKYILRGKSSNIGTKIGWLNNMKVEKWEIVYPVKRKSMRSIYAPKSYLTVYDYDWGNCFSLFLQWIKSN